MASTNGPSVEPPFVSTGNLPSPERAQALVNEAHGVFSSNAEGENSQVYPALARVPSQLFGICIVGASGNVYRAGDADYEFSIMSVSKPFVFALICGEIGVEEARARIGAKCDRLSLQFARGHRKKSPRSYKSDGQLRGHYGSPDSIPAMRPVTAGWPRLATARVFFTGCARRSP
jgi:hypothetical protein